MSAPTSWSSLRSFLRSRARRGFSDLLESYPEAVGSLFGLAGGVDITQGAGFVDAEFFSLMLPLLALALGIGSGAEPSRARRTPDAWSSCSRTPVRRRDAVRAKGAAVGLEVAVFCAAVFVALALASAAFGLDLPLGRLAGGVLGVGVLALLHGWLAIAVGAAWPSRTLAIGIPAAFAAAAYLVGGLHQLAPWLDPLRFASSFWWVGQSPLSNGVHWWHLPVVGAAAAAVLAAAGWLLERRDLETPVMKAGPGRGGSGDSALAARPVRVSAEILVNLALLPVGAEESADPEEHDSGNGDADARAEHRPVEPEGAAVIEQVDGEPHQAERDPDSKDRVEDPLAANMPQGFVRSRPTWSVPARPTYFTRFPVTSYGMLIVSSAPGFAASHLRSSPRRR